MDSFIRQSVLRQVHSPLYQMYCYKYIHNICWNILRLQRQYRLRESHRVLQETAQSVSYKEKVTEGGSVEPAHFCDTPITRN